MCVTATAPIHPTLQWEAWTGIYWHAGAFQAVLCFHLQKQNKHLNLHIEWKKAAVLCLRVSTRHSGFHDFTLKQGVTSGRLFFPWWEKRKNVLRRDERVSAWICFAACFRVSGRLRWTSGLTLCPCLCLSVAGPKEWERVHPAEVGPGKFLWRWAGHLHQLQQERQTQPLFPVRLTRWFARNC